MTENNQTGIAASDLLRLADYQNDAPLTIDLVYAQPAHPDNHFGRVYRADAQLFVHRLLLPTLLEAARLAQARHGWTLCYLDCFRSIEAQAIMAQAGYSETLVARPGQGAHPRGLAIDVTVPDIDFGTPFDFFADNLACNPAARDWRDLPPAVLQNRARLDAVMFDAAASCNLPLIAYAAEWWDYRVPIDVFSAYAPVSERELPPSHCMVSEPA